MKARIETIWSFRLKAVILIVVPFMIIELGGCINPEDNEEESGTQYTKSQTADETLNGAHLIMSYDSGSNSFSGTVENITTEVLDQVRVEIHLSNGTELGPTTPSNLAVGATMDVTLQATSTNWETWSVHPEAGEESGEGGHGDGD